MKVLAASLRVEVRDEWKRSLKALFDSSQKTTCKLAARTFIQSQYLEGLAASLRVGFCDESKRGLRLALPNSLGFFPATELQLHTTLRKMKWPTSVLVTSLLFVTH